MSKKYLQRLSADEKILTCVISSCEYGRVLTIMTLSRRSRGIPCDETISSVPLEIYVLGFQDRLLLNAGQNY